MVSKRRFAERFRELRFIGKIIHIRRFIRSVDALLFQRENGHRKAGIVRPSNDSVDMVLPAIGTVEGIMIPVGRARQYYRLVYFLLVAHTHTPAECKNAIKLQLGDTPLAILEKQG